MDINYYMTSCRNSIISLIKKYRVTKDEITLDNIHRMLEWRRDIFKFKDVKAGKTIVRMTGISKLNNI